MRSMMFALALVAGCVDTDAFNSDPSWDQGNHAVVHVSAASSFDMLEVRLPALGYQLFETVSVSPASTEYTYNHTETTGAGPRALAFTALLANVRVATGELPSITYPEGGETELAITLTAVAP